MGMLRENIPELRSPTYYQNKSGKRDRGSIPAAWAGIGWRSLCDRRSDPTCLSYAIGEQVRSSPKVLEKIKAVLADACNYLAEPEAPSEEKCSTVACLDKRFLWRDIKETRLFLGCDQAAREKRNVHFYVLSDADFVLDPRNRDKEIKSHIVDHFVVVTHTH